MSTNVIVVFVVLGLIVLGLSVYLGILYSRLRSRKLELEEAKERAEAAWREREEGIRKSLDTLALVLLQEQCGTTEGCIRIKRLIDEVEVLRTREELSVFHEMFEEVKDLAILEEYKQLSKQEKFKQDNRRFSVEEKYHQRIKTASQALRDILSEGPNFQ